MKIYALGKEEIEKQMKSGETKVSIIGFGYVGGCLGAFLSEKCYVTGIDPNEKIIQMVNNGVPHINEPGFNEPLKKGVENGKIHVTDDIKKTSESDVIIVTVGTPLNEDYEPNLYFIKKVAEDLGSVITKGDMIIFKSTVTPGVTEKIVKFILEEKSGLKAGEDFGLAFCPERLAEGSAMKEIANLPIIVGGINEKSSEIASWFWNSVGLNTIKVSSPSSAELAKLADNLWIDLNIALANELAKVCEKLDTDVLEVIKAANTLPKGDHMVNILYPGGGVGGSCLVKDPWFVYHIAKKHGVELKTPKASREINDGMVKHLFELAKKTVEKTGKKIENSRIAVLGLAFKGSTGDTRSAPSIKLIQILEDVGIDYVAYDPWVEKEESKKITQKIVHTLKEALKDADCIIVISDHPEFKEIDLNLMKSLMNELPCVVEGRYVFDSNELKKNGFVYSGVGRS
jgi:dTDP-alpha-D-glucose dehydrogenase